MRVRCAKEAVDTLASVDECAAGVPEGRRKGSSVWQGSQVVG